MDEEILKQISGLWLVTATNCYDCGNESTLRIFDHKPTKEEIDNVGGTAWCISRKIFNLSEVNGNEEIEQEEE